MLSLQEVIEQIEFDEKTRRMVVEATSKFIDTLHGKEDKKISRRELCEEAKNQYDAKKTIVQGASGDWYAVFIISDTLAYDGKKNCLKCYFYDKGDFNTSKYECINMSGYLTTFNPGDTWADMIEKLKSNAKRYEDKHYCLREDVIEEEYNKWVELKETADKYTEHDDRNERLNGWNMRRLLRLTIC